MNTTSHDYVVIGGGSAGSVVAARLAQHGADVLVLEAGGTDRRPDVLIPAGIVVTYKLANWKYMPEPDPSRGGVVEAWPAGRILGGGGSINATVFVRGHRADFDSWAKSGCCGWDYDAVLPYFKRLETWEGGAGSYRGGSGPIEVGVQDMDHTASAAFIAAARQAGHPWTEDYNGEVQEGVGLSQVNQRRGRRSHSARRYLRDLAPHDCLHVRTRAFVERVVFRGDQAIGVEYVHRGTRRRALARREVVLSAGSIASPRLLLVSGVGPADELARVGIQPTADSPGVGANFQEHIVMLQRWHASVATLNSIGVAGAVRQLADYLRSGRGALAMTMNHVQVIHRTDPSLDRPDTQIAFANFAVAKSVKSNGMPDARPAKENGFTVSTLMLHPRQRGRIRLRSARHDDRPIIEHQLLGSDDDVRDLLAGMAEARRIMSQPAMSTLVGSMFEPEANCRTEADWWALVRHSATYGIHPVGTCKMGVDEMAVVDPALRVNGVGGLRVVDASIMPDLPSGNTNAASMMIAEKAADLITGDASAR